MNELKFNVVQSIGEITANFDEFKNQVSQELEKYKSKEFTEDTKKDAKKDLAELRKKKAAVNERRIEVKKEYMKPYDEFEAKVKELITLIDEPITLIDYKVKKKFCLLMKKLYRANYRITFHWSVSTERSGRMPARK